MGSMWVDPAEDPKVYPTIPTVEFPVPDYSASGLTHASGFPEASWGADFLSMTALIEFTQYKDPGTGQTWQEVVLASIASPPSRPVDIENALKALVQMQKTERHILLPEILAQSGDFQMYFCSQLGIYPRTHPTSYLLLKIAARIGELVMVYLKRYHGSEAVRPSHLYPRLTPPLQVPPHAAYPSGHAMISAILAHTAGTFVPNLSEAAFELADRIARNREVAGLHFAWDSAAGKDAAKATFDIITRLYAFNDRYDAAAAEW